MDFIEILYKASEQDLCLEMHYMNLSGKLNRHIIYDIKVSKNYKYFKAYSFQYYEILNFKVENIKDIKVLTIDNSPLITLGTGPNEWTYIFSTNAKAPQSGIYVIACRGDNNNIIFEFYYIKKSECFWSYFTGENSHYDGYFEIEPIAFHFVPIFNRNSMLWTPFEYKSKKHFGSAICIRVFTENHEQKKTRVIDTGQGKYETIQIGSYNDLSQSSCFYYDATYCHYKDEYHLWYFHYEYDNILFKENISKKDFTILFKNCYDSHYEKKTLLSYCNMGKRYLAYHWISKFSDSGGYWFLYKKLKNNK